MSSNYKDNYTRKLKIEYQSLDILGFTAPSDLMSER